MLEELSITNFAIIDHLNVRFDSGFNVLTGETGAGKSIIIDAMSAAIGGRVSAEMVRTGADTARVEGIFLVDPTDASLIALLRDNELLDDSDETVVIVRRDIAANGRSTARVNGRSVPISTLTRIGERLVDIHGQSEHLSLFRVHEHVQLLDRFAGNDPLTRELQTLIAAMRRTRSERDTILRQQSDAERRLDLLRFQVDDITNANLEPDEDTILMSERRLLGNAEKLATLTSIAADTLSGTEEMGKSILDTLGAVSGALNELASIDDTQKENLETLNGALYALEEVGRALRSYQSSIESNPARLLEIEDRLDAISKLKRKYGDSIDAISTFASNAATEQSTLENSEQRLDNLAEELESLKQRVGKVATELSIQRHKAARTLAKGVEDQLADLSMARAQFVVSLTAKPDVDGVPANIAGVSDSYACDDHGVDCVEFLISPNPGEDPKPLVKIASGGEASRLMLALKTMLSTVDHTPTLIFDEVDTGVGGRSGHVIGEKLRLLSHDHQVLCITHLPQVAALGNEHFRITKQITAGRTSTVVEALHGDDRIEELAAMLGGSPPPAAAVKTAEELLLRGQGVALA